MKKLLFIFAIVFGMIMSFDVDARIGRVGGFRSHSFRSHSISRPSYSRPSTISRHTQPKANTVKSVDTTKTSKTVNVNDKTKTVDTVKTSNESISSNTIVKDASSNSIFTNAPLWFLIGHTTAGDKVEVINNTTEKFSCSECNSVKNEPDVYNACMKKCLK